MLTIGFLLTVVLAVNYVDRFLSSSCFQRDRPWMSQLAAATCLSLAAKVDEIDVPLLLDLQVEETKYALEAKTILRWNFWCFLFFSGRWIWWPQTLLLDPVSWKLVCINQFYYQFTALRLPETVMIIVLMIHPSALKYGGIPLVLYGVWSHFQKHW